jgi:hypothetical protein
MAENSSYQLLKRYRTLVEGKIRNNLKWFTVELNAEEFPVLNDDQALDMRNPQSLLQSGEKEGRMVDILLNCVKLEPSYLTKFVEILKKDRVRYKVVIDKLDTACFSTSATSLGTL